MTRSIRITLFGGQGHNALFSKKAAMATLKNAQSSTVAAHLLSRCHAAFLKEVVFARSMPGAPFTIEELARLQSPEDLLSPSGFLKNPVVQWRDIDVEWIRAKVAEANARSDDGEGNLKVRCLFQIKSWLSRSWLLELELDRRVVHRWEPIN